MSDLVYHTINCALTITSVSNFSPFLFLYLLSRSWTSCGLVVILPSNDFVFFFLSHFSLMEVRECGKDDGFPRSGGLGLLLLPFTEVSSVMTWKFPSLLVVLYMPLGCSLTFNWLEDCKIMLIDVLFGSWRNSFCSVLHFLAPLTLSKLQVDGIIYHYEQSLVFCSSAGMGNRYMRNLVSEGRKRPRDTVCLCFCIFSLLVLQLPVPPLLARIVNTRLCKIRFLLYFVAVVYHIRIPVWSSPAGNVPTVRNQGKVLAVLWWYFSTFQWHLRGLFLQVLCDVAVQRYSGSCLLYILSVREDSREERYSAFLLPAHLETCVARWCIWAMSGRATDNGLQQLVFHQVSGSNDNETRRVPHDSIVWDQHFLRLDSLNRTVCSAPGGNGANE